MAIDIGNLELEEFHSWNARLNSYFVSITAPGAISLYRAFYEKELIQGFDYVLLMYDKKNRVVGLKFSVGKDDLGKGVAKLNKQPDKSNAWISAGNFFKHYELDPKELKGKYIPVKHESTTGTVYLIDLNEKKGQ